MDEEKIQEMESELAELRPLKDSSVKLQEEFKQKEEAWLQEKKNLEESVNPNWSKARQRISSLELALKDKGVELNEDGSVKSNPGNVDVEKITQQAREAARSELLGNRLEELLEQYDPTSRGVVKHYYQKLSQGEGVTLQNIGKFVSQAERAAELDSSTPIKRVVTYSGGQGPRYNESGTVDKSKVEGLASKLGINIGETK